MKTKFSSIVKIKEQNLKNIEGSLAKARAEVRKAKNELDLIIDEIRSIKIPQKGSMSLLRLANDSLHSMQEQKKHKEMFVKLCESRVQEVLVEYKNANIEYEKMLHLHDVEIAKELKRIKELEQKELDEMSVVLYNLQNKEEGL
jgi:flagellar biosynthesis chaperone FliJ